MRRMTGSPLKPDVPKGPATITGYSVSGVAFVLAIFAFVQGDRSEQTLGVIAGGVVGLASLLYTNHIRGKQAVAQINAGAWAHVEPETDADPEDVSVERLEDLQRQLNDLHAARRMATGVFFEQPFDVRVEAGSLEPSPLREEYAAEAEVPLPLDTEGLDPVYDGRTGELADRLALEQREACS